MEVNGQFNVRGALSPVTETPVVTEEGAGWGPRAVMDVFDKREKKHLLHWPGIEGGSSDVHCSD
jgi:hypothetical protein